MAITIITLRLLPKYLICEERRFEGASVKVSKKTELLLIAPMLSKDSIGLRTFSRFRATQVSMMLEVKRDY